MDDDLAAGILRALAAGTNPGTGEGLADLAVWQHPDVGCALRLRGVMAQVITEGEARRGDVIRKL